MRHGYTRLDMLRDLVAILLLIVVAVWLFMSGMARQTTLDQQQALDRLDNARRGEVRR